jgi:hypothetical protein
MPVLQRSLLILMLVLIGSGEAARGEDRKEIDYSRDVKPILTRRCSACHGGLKQKSGLRLDTAAGVLKGGKGGPAIVPGKSEESTLVDLITATDGMRMPPEGEGEAVPATDVTILKAWIDAGAPRPSTEVAQTDPKDHWSFRPPVRPAVPSVSTQSPVRNPIDAFLGARHEALGLQPVPEAEKAVLLRRVSLDLTGLVPGPADLATFLSDNTADAYERAVDRLLASPRFGERWGRHWMDVWRYSDWDGFGAEIRESQPHIWHWRDWIVESLNENKGYDRMISEMLAADEIAPDDPGSVRATGFLARNWYKFNRNAWLDNTVEHTSKAFLGLTINCARCHDHKYDPILQREYYQLRAVFEPYDVRADALSGQPDLTKDALCRVYDARLNDKTFLFIRGNEKDPDKDHPLTGGVPAAIGPHTFAIKPVELSREAAYPGLRRFVQEELIARARAELKSRQSERASLKKDDKVALSLAEKAIISAQANLTSAEARIAADKARHAISPAPDADLLARLASLAERQAASLAADLALARAENSLAKAKQDLAPKPNDAGLKKRAADAEAARATATKDLETARLALAKDSNQYSPLSPSYPSTSTGRRSALARWIIARDNPLTARVAINHIWLRHFGSPLVPTVFDFGLNGKPPTHPELLDWLAVELMDRNWDLKAMHRLIVTSAAYRRRSTSDGASDANLVTDPDNLQLWRMNPRRMEAEAVRDNVLAVSGRLDSRFGGPDLDPEAGQTSGRRSLYFRHAKEKRMTFLRLFDSPNVTACYRRTASVAPQQALALANSPLSRDQARRLARDLAANLRTSNPTLPLQKGEFEGVFLLPDLASGEPPSIPPRRGGTEEVLQPHRESPDDQAFIRLAFDRMLGREPSAEENSTCLDYLKNQAQLLSEPTKLTASRGGSAGELKAAQKPSERARENLVHVLFNHNDFITIR